MSGPPRSLRQAMLGRVGSVVSVVFGLAVLVLLAAGVGWVLYTTVTDAPVVIAATITSLLAIVGLAVQRVLEKSREEEAERRKRMAPIYEQLLRTFWTVKEGGEAAEEKAVPFFEDLAQTLLLWGSEPVITAFNRWRTAVATEPEGHLDNLLVFEQLIFALRADLGNSSDGLGPGDLLRVFVNDIDDVLVPVADVDQIAESSPQREHA